MPEQLKNVSVSETRNSKFRELTAYPAQIITGRLHKAFPGIRPIDITIAGAIGTGIGTLMALRENNKSASLMVLLAAAGLDRLDGELARLIDSESPGSVDFKKGAIQDTLSDRVQELTMALGRTLKAYKRGNSMKVKVALANAVSNSLPSTAKAYAETQKVAVPENGKGLKGIIGTRAGRAVLAIATTVFPEVKGVPIQIIADTIVTAANITTTLERLNLAGKGHAVLSKTDSQNAEARFKALALFSAIAVGASAITYLHLENKPIKNTETRTLENTSLA